jgi:phosphopentomutase
LPVDWTLKRVDGLLGGLLKARPPEATVVLCSDHGNLEDNRSKAHTTNPVPLLVVGPAVRDSSWNSVRAITDVPEAILGWLDGQQDENQFEVQPESRGWRERRG